MIFDYQEICGDVLKDLPERVREVVVRRFGLKTGQKETLQCIGEDFGITRERVRQIEQAGFSKVRGKTERHQPVFQFISNHLKTTGNLRKEDVLLKILGHGNFQNQVFFLLSLADGFDRVLETRDFYTFWTIDKSSLNLAQKATKQISDRLRKTSKPLKTEALKPSLRLESTALLAFLEISKEIHRGPQGLWGLKDWPEINPRGVRDKAYIIFKREKKPLHFTEAARLIDESEIFSLSRKAHPQTVHNELIKDKRFVLVGRGLYALAEWGYKPGIVRDVISEVLRKAKQPLVKEEIVERVLKQRFVSKNTILLNLHNKKHFKRDSEGKYLIC